MQELSFQDVDTFHKHRLLSYPTSSAIYSFKHFFSFPHYYGYIMKGATGTTPHRGVVFIIITFI